ncbi:hypothetical protein [Anatilimnocola floriformis]|uniref:hypothetical protein n=1 Tax=Anatilimnocola floriformis TaxID=2948575 RepID=UPI0020C2EB6B|nr:hypothetical protein [Anatilimnocola floriformis]
MLWRCLFVFLLALIVLPAQAADEPAASPLTAKLIAKKDTYTLAADQQGEAFRKKLADPKSGEVYMPPAVDLILELTNPTDKPITIKVGADSGGLDLELKGPGAISISPRIAMTREFRGGKPQEIAAGATFEIPIAKLSYGMRGVSKQAFWTEPGEYALGVSYRYPGNDRTISKVTAEPIKVTVEAAK